MAQAVYNELTGEWEQADDNALFDPYAPATPPPPSVTWGQMNPPQNVNGGWNDEHTGGFVPANGDNPAGYMDLSYWASRGIPADQIFDFATGQVRPGWTRTANGYEHTAAAPQPTINTNTDTNPFGGGDGGGGSYQPAPRRTLGSLNYPAFNGPSFQAPPAFSYQDFKAPTIEDAQNEPGFEFALKQGLKAYENSKAYLGTYLSGGTIKGLNDYARNAASQNYSQVFDRAGQTYDRNRNNAADTYATNYGVTRDVFDRNYTAAKDAWSGQARAAELEFARDWDVYAYEGDDDYRRWKAQIDANT